MIVGVLAVRHAVLAQIPRAETRRDDLQRAALGQRARRRRAAALAAAAAARRDRARAVADLRAHGVWLPPGGRCHSARENPCHVGSPAGRLRRDRARAAASACRRRNRSCSVSSSAHVMCSRPGWRMRPPTPNALHCRPAALSAARSHSFGDAPPFGVQRQALEIAFARRRHAMPPVLVDDGDPVARQIDGRRAARRLRRGAGARLRRRRMARADAARNAAPRIRARHHSLPLALRSV